MFTPLLVRCGMILPFLPPLADLPPAACLLPTSDGSRTEAVERTTLSPEPPAVAAQTRELVQLRRTLRMSPLAGSVLDADPSISSVGTGAACSDEAEFVQVLHRVVESTPAEISSAAADEPPRPHRSLALESDDTAGFLRSMSRQLDDLANDREDQRDYETADRLRQLSDRLRRRARTETR